MMDSPEYTLPGIMNYLQSEFTQIEKMKIANNLELLEMKFKISKLEGVKNALNITNNKLVEDLNRMKNDNTKLLRAVYDLKKENLKLKGASPAVETPDQLATDVDQELRELISGLTATKTQSLLVKDIKLLGLKSGDTQNESVNSLDLAPLVTSRKFLQDCMKEMFYLIKNGNGNIVNNINDFSFDSENPNNGTRDAGNGQAGEFNVFEKYNYLSAEQQNDRHLEEEQRLDEDQNSHYSSQRSMKENSGFLFDSNRDANDNSSTDATDLLAKGAFIEKITGENFYSLNDSNTPASSANKYTLPLKAPEVFKDTGKKLEEEVKIKESEKSAPQKKATEDDGYIDEPVSDAETIVGGDDIEEEVTDLTTVDVAEVKEQTIANPGLTNLVYSSETKKLLGYDAAEEHLALFEVGTDELEQVDTLKVPQPDIVLWTGENTIALFNESEPYVFELFDWKASKQVKVNIIDSLKSFNKDNDNDEFLPLSDSTILSLAFDDNKLLVVCKKFYYLYDVSSTPTLSSYVLFVNNAKIPSIKYGKFHNGKVIILSENGKLSIGKAIHTSTSLLDFIPLKNDRLVLESSALRLDNTKLSLFDVTTNKVIDSWKIKQSLHSIHKFGNKLVALFNNKTYLIDYSDKSIVECAIEGTILDDGLIYNPSEIVLLK